MKTKNILPALIISQFACTSVWFAGNAVISGLAVQLQLPAAALGHLVSAVQLGFITGTLVFAVLALADRFSPSQVFFWCALAGAVANAGAFWADGFTSLLLSRLLTGFFLAGVYPVGMKIAADYHQQGLGLALGLLVGALVLGTAFPHLLYYLTTDLAWQYVIGLTSALSVLGGVLLLLRIADGPYRAKGTGFRLLSFVVVFRDKQFRSAAFGYFGHMWELYSFWAFVPVIFGAYLRQHPQADLNPSLFSFITIGIGAVACWLGGYLARAIGSAGTAFGALLVSFLLCLLSPLLGQLPLWAFLLFMLTWGMAVVMDSPQFSTLVARNAPASTRGTALTIVNCIGFSITILSIQVLRMVSELVPAGFQYQVLAIGPLLGLLAMLQGRLLQRTGQAKI